MSSTGIDSLYNGAIVRTSNQTFYVFDSFTVDNIVKDLIRGDECKETEDSLKSLITSLDASVEVRDEKIKEQSKSVSILKQKLELKDEIITLKDKDINRLSKSNKIKSIGIISLSGITLVLGGVIVTTLILLH